MHTTSLAETGDSTGAVSLLGLFWFSSRRILISPISHCMPRYGWSFSKTKKLADPRAVTDEYSSHFLACLAGKKSTSVLGAA